MGSEFTNYESGQERFRLDNLPVEIVSLCNSRQTSTILPTRRIGRLFSGTDNSVSLPKNNWGQVEVARKITDTSHIPHASRASPHYS